MSYHLRLRSKIIVALVLEEYEHALKRGAKIYAEVKGYGLSGDAYHITSPSEDGDGGYRSMKAAVENSGIPLHKIDYINAHGTSTPAGDEIEIKAVERLFGDHTKNLCMSTNCSPMQNLLLLRLFHNVLITNGI